jgi:hypothetical protein
MTLGLLGETAIDISGGNDHSGKAEAGRSSLAPACRFLGSDREVAGIVGPVATEATATLKTCKVR